MRHPHPDIVTCASAVELVEKLADAVAVLLENAILKRGRGSLVVSGGKTPGPLFAELSGKNINWSKIVITLADERWVDPSDPSSNEHLVRSLLLHNSGTKAKLIGLKNNAPTATAGEKEANLALAAVPRPFDLVILGMGNDGHTASLFPGADRLAAAVDMHSGIDCMAITPPRASFERMTMTLPSLLDSRQILLHITGKEKQEVLNKALAGGSEYEMPVRFILNQHKTPVQIYWSP